MTDVPLAIRRILTDYRWLVIGCCVLALFAGAWISYGVYVDPGEETEEVVVDDWSTTGSLTHSAVVTEPNSLYAVDTRLSNQPLYYTGLMPEFEGEFVTNYQASTSEDVTVDIEVTLRWFASDDEHTYWEEHEQVATTTESSVEPGDEVTTSFAANVTALEDRMDEIEGQLGASPGDRQAVIEIERTIEGSIDGQPRTETETDEVGIDLDGSTYCLESPDAFGEDYTETEAVSEPKAYGLERSLGGPLLAVLGLIGLGAFIAMPTDSYRLTSAESRWLEYQAALEEYGELVTRTRLPSDATGPPEAPVDTLESLVQLGIDLEAPILEDERTGRVIVLTDKYRYVFNPPEPPATVETADEHALPRSVDDKGNELLFDSNGNMNSDDPRPTEENNQESDDSSGDTTTQQTRS